MPETADKRSVVDWDVHAPWRARAELGDHDQNLQVLDRLLESRPADADLHLLQALTLSALDREDDALAAVYRAIECGEDDAVVMTRAASQCFFKADLETARRCVDRAKAIASREFPLSEDLKDLDRHLTRRERGKTREMHLSQCFDAEPEDRRVASDFARYLVHVGRDYSAYYVVARGLLYHPEDRRLRRLKRKLVKVVPGDERRQADEWAASGEPMTNLSWKSAGGRSRPREDASEVPRHDPG
jgi:Flp pilus assembly protein TadD